MLNKFTAIFAALLFLTACGQTGPLYLPVHQHPVPVIVVQPPVQPPPPPNIQPTQDNHE